MINAGHLTFVDVLRIALLVIRKEFEMARTVKQIIRSASIEVDISGIGYGERSERVVNENEKPSVEVLASWYC